MSTFTPDKPKAAGAYWIRGNGLERPYLVEVVQSENDGLLCNLHQRNTELSFDYHFPLADLDPDFEWLGPLEYCPPELAELQARLREQGENLATLRAGTLAMWQALGVTDLSDALAKINNLSAWERAAREREAILQKLEGLFALLRRVVGEDKADGVEAAKELLKVVGGVE